MRFVSSVAVVAALLVVLFAPTAHAAENERPIEFNGELEVLMVEDFERHRAHRAYFVHDQRSRRYYELKFKTTPPGHLKNGQRITVRGRAKGRQIAVETLDAEPDDAGTPANAANLAVAMAGTAEERRALLLVVDLLDAKASTSSHFTLEEIPLHMWTGTRSVDGLYRGASLEQLSFPPDSDSDGLPDISGPFQVDLSKNGCDYHAWAYAAEDAAQGAGIDLSLYQHRVFVLPNWRDLPDCQWSGIANVGCGSFCRAWIAEAESPMVYAHELGHNLSMAHAATDPENDGQANAVYGDYSDPMGLSRHWHRFNAPHIDQMGWYETQPNSITTVTASGTYDIAPIGIEPSATPAAHVLKIAQPDSGNVYYLSYRQAIGYDDSLSSTYTEGTNIHHYQGSGYGYTHFIKALTEFDDTFSDAVNEITVRQLSQNGETARVDIVLGPSGSGCAPVAPSVDLSPANQSGSRGELLTYSVSITNNDQGSCSATALDLTIGGQPSGTLAPTSLTLPPGGSATATLQLDTAGLTDDGAYPFDVEASDADGAEPHHASPGRASASMTVDGTAPSVPTGPSGSADGSGAVQLSWNASNDPLSGVAAYTVYRDSSSIGGTTATSYTDPDVVAGVTYSYTVTATDGVGNESAPSLPASVTVSPPDVGEGSLHIADLDAGALNNRSRWTAMVTVTAHSLAHQPRSGVTVNGTWNGGASGIGSCVTAGDGRCTISQAGIRKKFSSATLTVTSVVDPSLSYDAAANHDSDGDSNGTTMTVMKP